MKKILHFTADWCQPCKRLKPIIEEFLSKNSDIQYEAIDVDVHFEKAEEYFVMSIPTLIVIQEDGTITRHTGMADYEKIESLVNG
jgi:thioredoxin 1